MHKLVTVILVVMFCSSSLFGDGNLYMEEGRYTTFMSVESIIDGWSLTSLAHNPSQLVFVGKEKQIQMQYELQSLQQWFYYPNFEDKIHALALWDQDLFPNFDFGVLALYNKHRDPLGDWEGGVFKSITLSSSFKDIIAIGATYNHFKWENVGTSYDYTFNIGISGRYRFKVKDRLEITPVAAFCLTNRFGRADLPLSSHYNGGGGLALGVETKIGNWITSKHSFELGVIRVFNQSIGLTPFFTLFHKWGEDKEFIMWTEAGKNREAWSGFSFQFNLQKFQSFFGINKVPQRFNLDIAYKRFGFGGWIDKKNGFDDDNSFICSYIDQFSIGVAFLPERDKK